MTARNLTVPKEPTTVDPREAQQMLDAAARVQRRSDDPVAWAALRRTVVWAGAVMTLMMLAASWFVGTVPSAHMGPVSPAIGDVLPVLVMAWATAPQRDVIANPPRGLMWGVFIVDRVAIVGVLTAWLALGLPRLALVASVVAVALACWAAVYRVVARRSRNVAAPPMPVRRPHRLMLRSLLALFVAGVALVPSPVASLACAGVDLALLAGFMLKPEFGVRAWADDWSRDDIVALCAGHFVAGVSAIVVASRPSMWAPTSASDSASVASAWTHVGGPLAVVMAALAAAPMLWRLAVALRGRRTAPTGSVEAASEVTR